MKNWFLVAAIGIAVLLGVTGLALLSAYVSANNKGVAFEKGIEASYKDSQNVLGQHAPKIKEALQVTEIQVDGLKELFSGANTSRYGEDGSGAAVQWIKEQNPNLDQSSYSRIITMIEAGRTDFQKAQKQTIDRYRAYETALGTMPGSFFYRMAGYPTPKFMSAGYDKVVQSSHSTKAFETGIDDGVSLK